MFWSNLGSFSCKERPRRFCSEDFVANEKLETGEFNDIVSARLYELETQVKQLIIVKTPETQFAKQNARIQQCEDTLEKQAATLKEMKKSKADVEERIS